MSHVILAQGATTLVDLLRRRATAEPEKSAYVYLKDGLTPERELNYEVLDHRARVLAGWLQQHAQAGDRALLLYSRGLDVVIAFWACLYAGVIAIPAPPPDPASAKRSVPRLKSIVQDAQVTLLLASPEIIDALRPFSGELGVEKNGQWIESASIAPEWADRWEERSLNPGDLAYLQYTSGSTSAPKGVMITHANLFHHCEILQRAAECTRESRCLSWLPYFHDYGLVHGVVVPVFTGTPSYLMSPLTFLKKPMGWLEAVSRHRITHSGGPNFAYDSCIRAFRQERPSGLDLSSWEVASCGAEPIRHSTVTAFVNAFQSFGLRPTAFSPAYGMAEYTLLVSLKEPTSLYTVRRLRAHAFEQGQIVEADADETTVRSVVGCGRPVGDTKLVIVDPSSKLRCAKDRVGEIWLSGGSVANGYWNRPEETEQIFGAYLADSGEGPFLRTGDLGFVNDGQVFITGRLKDLIIVRGRNHYPQDIELTVERSHPAMRPGGGVAFAVEGHEGEQLVVVQEVLRQAADLDFEEIGARVRETVAEQHELHLYDIVFIKAGSLPKTSSGKVQRKVCKENYQADRLSVVGRSRLEEKPTSRVAERLTRDTLLALPQDAMTAAVAKHLRGMVARVLSVDSARLSLQQSLRSFGLDSLMAIRLKNQIEESLGVFLPLSTLLGGPSIESLATIMSSTMRAGDFSCDAKTESFEGADCSLSGSARQFAVPLTRPEHIPLSFAQQRLWFLDQLEPAACLYNLPMAVRFSGPLDASLLETSFGEIVRRHEALRTTFPLVIGEPRQVIAVAWNITFPVIDLQGLTEQACRTEWTRIVQEEIGTPFDLTGGPLMKGKLLRFSEQEHVLLLVVHHMVIDGWSMGVLLQEFAAIYEAGCKGVPAVLPELSAQYADFSLWEIRCAHDEVFEQHLNYWKSRLAGASLLDIPTDHPRPAVQRFQGAVRSRVLPSALVAALDRLGGQHGVTRYMTLLTAFFCLLSRYTGQTDIVVGSTMANRSRAEIEPLIGMFVNTVALRADLSGDLSVSALLEQVRTITVEAYDHQGTPFEQVVDALQLNRDLSRMPLIPVLFTWEPPVGLPRRIGGLSCSRQEIENGSAVFDVTLSVRDQDGEVRLTAEYNRDLFEASTIERLLAHLEVLATAITEDPNVRVATLPLLTAEERQLVVVDWNRTEADYSIERRLPDMIAEQASRTPDAPAVVCGRQQLTYRELMQQAGGVARELQALGVGPNVIVGLCLERSVEMVVGILAILQAGGAYLPLDPTYPHERLTFMLQDANAAVVVTQMRLTAVLPSLGCPVVCLDGERTPWPEAPCNQTAVQNTPDSLAYVIYTSGSAGKPKGVLVNHRNLSQSIQACHHYYQDPVQACLIAFSFAFDGSVYGTCWTLSTGGAVILPSEGLQGGVSVLADLITEHKISHLVLVPSLYSQLLTVDNQSRLDSVKVSILAGEDAPLELVHRHHRLLPNTALFNAYGPTEATIWASVYRTGPQEPGPRVPIGRPIANTALYILDPHQQPVPIGLPGELYISGPGVAQGYVNRPDLTAERFLPNPFVPGQRLYRTGDLAKFRSDGQIEFLGRRDQQIKLRGYRIELGEIEQVLGACPLIEQAIVCLREDTAGQPRLVAYLKSQSTPASSFAQVKAFLVERVPAYMVPSAFMWMEQFPLTVTGKIDRRSLPDPDEARVQEGPVVGAPRSPVEQALLEIWKGVLNVREVGIHDHFFEMGGHSLLATQVASRIRETFEVELPLRLLFEKATIAELAIEIEQYRRRAQGVSVAPPIVPVSREQPLPLSFSQQRMWFMYQFAPEGTAYNMPATLKLTGPLNRAALEHALTGIVRRHEAFRTTVVMTADGPMQVIGPYQQPRWEDVDLRHLPYAGRALEAASVLARDSRRPFDLLKGPLARFMLIQIEEEEHILLLNMHHIIGDQWSFAVIGREFTALYNDYCRGRLSIADPSMVQYADFAVWERQWINEEMLQGQLSYWQERLAGLQVLALPTDYPRPQAQQFIGSYRSIDLTDELLATLSRFSAQRGCTLFMTLLAAFQILLGRYANQEDIAIGVPIANRTRLSTEGIVGTFVNTLVMRTDVSGNPTFSEVLQRVREAALGAYDHQDLPFERLVEKLDTKRDLSYAPLVQVLFNVWNAPMGEPAFDGLTWAPFEFDGGAAQFDLAMAVDTELTKKAYLSFRTDLFDGSTIERMAAQYKTLLDEVAHDPQKPIADYRILSRSDRSLILHQWNDSQSIYPHQGALPQLITEQARLVPDAIAVSMDGVELTYAALETQSNQLAHYLRRAGVQRGELVGLCVDRSLRMMVGLLGVLKAGAAYVSLDPDYPSERLSYMLDNSGSRVIVTTADVLDRVPHQGRRAVCLDQEARAIGEESTVWGEGPHADDVAYVIYTSGSTGKPKGVEICHRALVNFLWSMRTTPGCLPTDVLLAVTTLSFDIAGLELYLPLVVGGRVELVSRHVVSDGRLLMKRLAECRPTIMQATPATWRMLIDSGWDAAPNLKALCGGEALSRELADHILTRVGSLWNMYGPTETTIWSTVAKIESGRAEITIGRPIANTQLYILDAALQPVPIGVPGELYIGGDGVARGYRHRPELTAERFIHHPFSDRQGARLYKTGDLARYRPDGCVVHLGRLDHQVKIRGFRIELGEIEAVLNSHRCVRQTVVSARPDASGMKQLVAYVIPTHEERPTDLDLKAFLRSRLPEYMIPSHVVMMEHFPLTANGKVNVQALPDPEDTPRSRSGLQANPGTPLEVQLTALWQQVLGVRDVGLHDNFFDLGGQSLKAVQLFAYLEQVFGKHLPLATLFRSPTIAELASILSREQWAPPWRSLVAIQPGGTAIPIFAVPGVGGNVLVFAKLSQLLGQNQPFYGLQTRGLDGRETPFTSVAEMAAHYLDEIHTVQPTGPYIIAGTCTGGVVAYEIAQQLMARRERVILMIIESWHPMSYNGYAIQMRRFFRPVLYIRKRVLEFLSRSRGLSFGDRFRLGLQKLEDRVDRAGSVSGVTIFGETFSNQRVAEATLEAVAFYKPHEYKGMLLNVMASERVVGDSVVDTRTVWEYLARGGATSVRVPAENSGRLFVSPYVEELSGHILAFLAAVDAQDENVLSRSIHDMSV